MGILIPRQLTQEQYIKLFSNPVSGIACEFRLAKPSEIEYIKHVQDNIKYLSNIRYSKSMMVRALDFWFDQVHAYCMKVWKIPHPLINAVGYIMDELKEIGKFLSIVKELPDSFLFSHRYIIDTYSGGKTGYKYSKPMNTQLDILNKKYPVLLNEYESVGFQKQTIDPYYKFSSKTTGIEFTVFPNEHPYIPKQKISRVGMTDKGNVYVLHKKNSNGA